MPALAPYVDPDTSWTRRSGLYRDLLSKPDTILLLAIRGAELIGYGLAHVMQADETWTADTWKTAARVGEIESLGVLSAHRGQGIGTSLLDGLEQQLAAIAVTDLVIGVLPANTAAVRMYERRGFKATWTYLSRFDGR